MTSVEMKLEVVQVPVSDVDRARDFYSEQLGFNVDVDRVVPGGMRVVQLTPPGSGCSIQLVEGREAQRGLTLVVSDIVAVHAELTMLGAPLSDVIHFEDGKQMPGHSDEPWSTMVFFTDLDGNKWIMQERPAE
jgi:catechol 2,3-dioxygenase-like lactoylglutathione lyase family enzyme